MSETNRPWWDGRRSEGFRFSPADALVVALCAAVTWLAWTAAGSLALLAPVVLAHFFLFCNVFRVGRRPEYLWAAVFVLNVALSAFAGSLSWPRIILAQSPVTLAVMLHALTRPDYHGLGCSLLGKPRKA